MVPTAAGWAILDRNHIKIRTVSDTRRAAIVNWLCTEKGVLVHNGTTDEQIEAAWHAECGDAICTTVDVNVTPR